ncbi:MAG: hypothetical protein GH143_02545 [Calditrichaeota bacterium]|nr:hypothetical protein [Calditrichota bacterium]
MQQKALEKIRKALTPEVIIQSAHDIPGGIAAVGRLTWTIPSKNPGLPRCLGKVVTIETDEDGNFLEEDGLL